MTTKPKGRPAKPDMRTYQVRMTETQHAEFKRLGGSAWLQKRLNYEAFIHPFTYTVPIPVKVKWK